ncbi:MAG: DUF4956 domain-containing protein [Clostridia bacterium]|nr:DUF4956 domain-containing protein [Clostridia bacterium]
MFDSILENVTSTLSITNLMICMLVSLILGMIIALVHMYTSKYTKNFIISLAILPALVQVVIMMVNGNLGTSVAVLGAFGLVRFRSIPGNSKEIVSVFFAMAIGLAIGMGYIVFSIGITLIISFILILLYKTNFGAQRGNEKKLKIVIPEELDYTSVFEDIMEEYTKNSMLEKVKTINMGSMYEITYNIILKNDKNEKDFLDKIRIRNGNLNVTLMHAQEGVMEL